MKILIVEDENIIAQDLNQYISTLGYKGVGLATNGDSALKLAQDNKPDIVLMDICIKGEKDGIETASDILKHDPSVKIIFLTAHTDSYHIDRAVKIDPVAYLAKPYNPKELEASLKIAKYQMIHQNISEDFSSNLLRIDEEFSYDEENDMLYQSEVLVHLTRKEREILSLLIQNRNKVVDIYTIENTIWPDKDANANTVRTLMRRLRPKLKHHFIKTLPSQGYVFICA